MSLIIPPFYEYFHHLGIDPGSVNTGLAIFRVNSRSLKIEKITPITMQVPRLIAYNPFDEEFVVEKAIRYEKLLDTITEVIQTYGVVRVSCESSYYYPKTPQVYGVLIAIVNLLRHRLLQINQNIVFTIHPPRTVKQFVGAEVFANDQDKTKKSVLDALNKIDEIRLNTDIELEFLSDHAIDAMAIGYIDLKKGLSL